MKFKLIGISAAVISSAGIAHATEVNPTEIMLKNFFVTKVQGSTQTVTLELTSESGGKRVRKTSGYTKLQKNGRDSTQVVRFLSPPDVKNTASLMVEHSEGDDDIWIYLPALKKVRRIVASNKKDSFMGTDFSYGDVIGQKVGDWTYKLVKEGDQGEIKVFVIEATPKSDAVKSSSGYSKVLYTIRQDNFATVKAEYWDLSGRLLKEIIYSDLKEVDPKNGKWQAMKIEAKDFQTGHKTAILFDSYALDPDVKDEFFTTRYLERER